VNACIKCGMNASSLCEKVAKIGSVTSEFTNMELLQKLGKNDKKLAYSTKYCSNYWTDLYQTLPNLQH